MLIKPWYWASGRAFGGFGMLRAGVVISVLAASAAPAAAAPSKWQLAGKTYNSVAFVDLNSVFSEGGMKSFTAIRVSGQPKSDGWRKVVQRLRVNCSTRIFEDAGSRIEKNDGTIVNYPGSGASQKAVSRGVFFDMFEVVCSGRSGTRVTDPEAWTLRYFKPGD